MENHSISLVVDLIAKFGMTGIIGVLIVVFYLYTKNTAATLAAYREDSHEWMIKMEGYMREQRQMYENNVQLVKDYYKVSSDFKDVLCLNIQTLTQLTEGLKK